jgi:hypothetical protein
MRMSHYFAAGAALFVVALGFTLWSGLELDAGDRHLWAGLFTASLGVAVHTLTILFMLVTGRVLREAIRSRALAPEFLAELNHYFARKRAFPLAALAAASLVATGVLGFAPRGFGISPAWHWGVALLAIALNLWALQQELAALRENQRLIDRAAGELDLIDRARERSGAPPPSEERDPADVKKWGLAVAVGAWFPYFYWAVVAWRGDFSRVSVHPWIEVSAFGLLVGWLAQREARARARDRS